ncbi:hypothetical protein [Methylobacterium sp. J-059]|uniref:hypothetical protein n=1 Tax=Methylobacterium sp. J-059 TaxID=2836643 RepID=UPI002444CDA4|nr:hypothetical protein [Methylobacterium sp. J-059]
MVELERAPLEPRIERYIKITGEVDVARTGDVVGGDDDEPVARLDAGRQGGVARTGIDVGAAAAAAGSPTRVTVAAATAAIAAATAAAVIAAAAAAAEAAIAAESPATAARETRPVAGATEATALGVRDARAAGRCRRWRWCGLFGKHGRWGRAGYDGR